MNFTHICGSKAFVEDYPTGYLETRRCGALVSLTSRWQASQNETVGQAMEELSHDPRGTYTYWEQLAASRWNEMGVSVTERSTDEVALPPGYTSERGFTLSFEELENPI